MVRDVNEAQPSTKADDVLHARGGRCDVMVDMVEILVQTRPCDIDEEPHVCSFNGVTTQASGGTQRGQRTRPCDTAVGLAEAVGMPSELPELRVRVVLCVTTTSTECRVPCTMSCSLPYMM
jgi:hypothetical protein